MRLGFKLDDQHGVSCGETKVIGHDKVVIFGTNGIDYFHSWRNKGGLIDSQQRQFPFI
jgi:hypothetical protein